MAGEEDQNVYEEEEDEDEESEEDEDVEDLEIRQRTATTAPRPEEEEEEDFEEEEEDLNSPSPSTSSSFDQNPKNPNPNFPDPKPSPSPTVTIALPAVTTILPQNGTVADMPPPATETPCESSRKRQKTDEKKPPATLDDSRRLFQRLWTDEDEIGLLQGFLDYTSQRVASNSSAHHDTAPFYDQIKDRLQLDFNKNQLVEKLRRLKKKYRNVVNRISSGKEFTFKTPHDQTTFEISRKIWSTTGGARGRVVEDGGLEDEEGNLQNNANSNNANSSEKKASRSRRRSRKRPAVEPEENLSNFPPPPPSSSNVPNVIEDTVRSCLSPLFKELLYCAINGPCNSGIGGVALNPLPLNFNGNSVGLSSSEVVDERWRKQQILELEVYSKRLELVQEQIKSSLEELKSMGS